MEKRDLYDINGNLTGKTIYINEPVPKDKRISVVLVFIENSKGEFLVQKRSAIKTGTFGFTGGHPKSGETIIQGMQTEIKEELGLTVSASELKLINSGIDDECFYNIYYMKKDIDISSLTIQKEEVDFVKWFTIDEINSLIKNGLFFKNHYEAYQIFLKLRKEGAI